MASSQPQQINVSDLDIQQLADVRRQLEEVTSFLSGAAPILNVTSGTKSLDQFLCSTQAGSVKIQVLPRERRRNQTQECR